MSVVIHQDAIDKLAFAPGVIDDIRERAEKVVDRAQYHVGQIMDRTGFASEVSDNIGFTMDRNQAIIGIRDDTTHKGKSREQYLAAKQADPSEASRPHGHWLTKGLEETGFRPA